MSTNNKEDNWVTVLIFNYPHETYIVTARLESQGIDYFIKDELTASVHPFYSNAIGGVKLQVKESNLPETIAILQEGGYLKDEDETVNDFFSKSEKYFKKIPLLSKLPHQLRIVAVLTIIIFLILTLVYIITLPSLESKLTENDWCLDYVVYKGKIYYPQTNAFKIDFGDNCQEVINFNKFNSISLPGFQSGYVYGDWKLDDEKIQIFNTDTFSHVYSGNYQLELSENKLILKSDKTTLYCRARKNIF